MAARIRALPLLGVLLVVAGCTTSRSTLTNVELELLRTLAMRCYLENRELLVRRYSPDTRLACRERAERQADRL